MNWFEKNFYNLIPWLSLILVVLVQPVVNFLINWMNIRQKQREEKYETEIMAYREFAKTYGYLRFNSGDKAYWEFASSANQVAIIVKDEKIKNKIFNLLDLMRTDHYPNDHTDTLFRECLDILSRKIN